MSGPRADPDQVRPYVRTGGRTRPSTDVRLESLVFPADGDQLGLDPDARRVLDIFTSADGGGLSVADIAGELALPPSTIRIIVADLIDRKLLTQAPVRADPHSISLIERVLNGLRAHA